VKIRVLNTEDRGIKADAARLARTLGRDSRQTGPTRLTRPTRRAKPARAVVNVVLVGNRRIRELNRQYLKRDRPTDVLAFPLGRAWDTIRNPKRISVMSHAEYLLGEVYVSRDQARLQARENGVSYHDEVRRLVLHGILHLLGLTHKQMEAWYKRHLLQKISNV
jgi:rRNA maturation RNase YbeY